MCNVNALEWRNSVETFLKNQNGKETGREIQHSFHNEGVESQMSSRIAKIDTATFPNIYTTQVSIWSCRASSQLWWPCSDSHCLPTPERRLRSVSVWSLIFAFVFCSLIFDLSRDHRPAVHLLLPLHRVRDVAADERGRATNTKVSHAMQISTLRRFLITTPHAGRAPARHLLLVLHDRRHGVDHLHRLRAQPALPYPGDARDGRHGEDDDY